MKNKKDREIAILRDVLKNIVDITIDYDGYGNSLDGCKDLIDEISYICKEALSGRGITYLDGSGDIINVLNEKVGEYKEDNDYNIKLNYFDKNRKDY